MTWLYEQNAYVLQVIKFLPNPSYPCMNTFLSKIRKVVCVISNQGLS
jgi:hypothetical protein